MPKILLVEDDPFILDIYKEQFMKAGFTVEVATDGQMALDQVKNVKPDVLVSDILLPKIGGWELVAQIREDDALKNVKIIVISNLDRHDFEENITKFKIDNYFLKIATTPEEITNAIKEILK